MRSYRGSGLLILRVIVLVLVVGCYLPTARLDCGGIKTGLASC